MTRTLAALTFAIFLSGCATNRQATISQTPAEQLGWQLGIHERTFEKFTIYEAMDKTAALGLKYMSLSAKP